MRKFEIELDVKTVYREEIEAETEEQAVQIAKEAAYQDTWGCRATYDDSTVYVCEEVEEEVA
jgi:hypothetical protein